MRNGVNFKGAFRISEFSNLEFRILEFRLLEIPHFLNLEFRISAFSEFLISLYMVYLAAVLS